MSTIIIKNETNQGRFLEDLGIYIDATSELTLSDIFTIDDISDSKDLEDLVNSETLIVNNGVNDLDRYSGLKHINLETVYEDDETEDVIISDTTSEPEECLICCGYTTYATITVDYTKIEGGSDLIDYPLEVKITDSTLKTTENGGRVTSSSGYDIIFRDSTSDLDFEILSYDGDSGFLMAYVRIPVLDAESDTTIYMCYGNSSITTSQEDITGTWNSDYKAVWHLRDDILDATLNDNDLTAYNIEPVTPITIDNTTTSDASTFSHTTGSLVNGLLIVAVAWRNIGDDLHTVSSVTYDGDPLTLIRKDEQFYDPPGSRSTALYYMISPSSGSNNVVVTFSASPWEYSIAAITFSNVDQTNPIEAHNGVAGGSSTEASVSLTTLTDNALVLETTIIRDSGTETIGTGQTQRWNYDPGYIEHYGSTKVQPTAGSVTMSWSFAGSELWTISACAIRATTSQDMFVGREFNGTNGYMQSPYNGLKTANNFMILGWFKSDVAVQCSHMVWEGEGGYGNGWGDQAEMHISIGAGGAADDVISTFLGDDGYTTESGVLYINEDPFTDTSEWHQFIYIVQNLSTSPAAELIIDGVSSGTDTGTTSYTTRGDWDTNLRLGRPGPDERYFDGKLASIKILEIADKDLALTIFNNEDDPSTFYDVTYDDQGLTPSTYTTIQVVDNGGGVNINVVTPIAAPFNAEICKDSDVFTHSNLTNNSRITVEETGLYKISYSICWSIGTANDANVRTRIRKNGDTYIAPSTSYGYAINPDQPYGSNAATVFVSLSADDYIEIMCDRAGDVPAATTLSGTSQLFMELY